MKRRFFLLTVLVVAMTLCVCPICAASSCTGRLADKAEPITLPFPVEITFETDGSWKLGLFDSGLTLSSDFLAMVAGMFGQAIPEATSEQIGFFTANNVQHIVLIADAGKFKTWVNGRMMPEIQVLPAAVGLLAENGIKAEPLEFVLRLQGQVYVRFPVVKGVDPIELPEDLEAELATSAEPAVNLIEIGATVALDGRIVSIAGFTVEEILSFGFEPPMPQSVEEFPLVASHAMKTVGSGANVEINSAGAGLNLDGEPLIQVAWDEPSRMAGLRLAEVLVGIEPERGVARNLEEWLATTRVAITVHMAEGSVEGLPAIQLQRPLGLEYAADGSWRLEGIGPEDFGYRSFKVQSEFLERFTTAGVQHIQAMWTGNSVHSSVNGEPLAIIELGSGWGSMAFRIAGYKSLEVDGKVEQTLSNFRVPVVVRFPVDEEAEPIGLSEAWIYEPTATAPTVTAEVTATLDRTGRFELDGVQVPGLGRIQVPVAVDLAWTPSPVAPSELMASIGPNGLVVQADEVTYEVRWDAATLEATTTLADAFGLGATARQVAGVASTVAITATVQIEVPPSAP